MEQGRALVVLERRGEVAGDGRQAVEPGRDDVVALDGGPDGLDVFRRLLELAATALEPGGTLAVELYEGSLDDAAALAGAQGGWATVEVREDLTRRPRVLVCTREG